MTHDANRWNTPEWRPMGVLGAIVVVYGLFALTPWAYLRASYPHRDRETGRVQWVVRRTDRPPWWVGLAVIGVGVTLILADLVL